MKDAITIDLEIEVLKGDLKKKKETYSKMHQIELMSGEGNQCIEEMSCIEGKITALKWVLNGGN